MPERLRHVLGADAALRGVLVEQAASIGPDLGPGPRPVIEQALDKLNVQRILGSAVVALDADGITTADGTRIDARTVIWTGGMRASALTEQVSGKRDKLGRLQVERDLRVDGVATIFAAGDVALAATDDSGHHAMMACPARDRHGPLRRPQHRRRPAGPADQALPAAVLRHLPGPGRLGRSLYRRLGSPGENGRRRRQGAEDQDQHPMDLSAVAERAALLEAADPQRSVVV